MKLADAKILVVGVGGLGSPASEILVRSGVGALTLLDDDVVEESNLHRQILFGPGDVGRSKTEGAANHLRSLCRDEGLDCRIEAREERLLPETALELIEGHDLVLEGADNFATKFLAADASTLAGVPLAQAGAVRWSGWAMAHRPGRGACLRCVFEDIPGGGVETCAEAGVVGPVVGVLGALSAALAVRTLLGEPTVVGELWSYRGLAGGLRRSRVRPRPECPLCSGAIGDLRRERYMAPCAA